MLNDPVPLDQITDAILPDGTTVPAVYVKLRNHINRIGMGIGSKVNATSWQSLMYLWSEEDAAHEIEMSLNRYFDAMEYHALSGRPLEECQEILGRSACPSAPPIGGRRGRPASQGPGFPNRGRRPAQGTLKRGSFRSAAAGLGGRPALRVIRRGLSPFVCSMGARAAVVAGVQSVNVKQFFHWAKFA